MTYEIVRQNYGRKRRWRVFKAAEGRHQRAIAANRKGGYLDGGGHASKEQAERQVKALMEAEAIRAAPAVPPKQTGGGDGE